MYLQVLGADDSPLLTPTKLKRSVRLVRTVTREGDVVSRIDDRTLAVLLPGLGLGEDISARLSRLVALGLIPDAQDHKDPTLRFRIVATSYRHYNKKLRFLNTDLRQLLDSNAHWKRKSIQYISKGGARETSRIADSAVMDAMWNHALDAELAEDSARSVIQNDAPQKPSWR